MPCQAAHTCCRDDVMYRAARRLLRWAPQQPLPSLRCYPMQAWGRRQGTVEPFRSILQALPPQ